MRNWLGTLWSALTFVLPFLRKRGLGSPYAEIDRAWDAACRALRKEKIALHDVPLFLVLGRPETGDANLFRAAQLQPALVVNPAPANPLAPIHVFANRDAIFVTCPGASLLGKHASLLTLEGEVDATAVVAHLSDPNRTMDPATIFPAGGMPRPRSEPAPTMGGIAAESASQRRAARRAAGKALPNLLHDRELADTAHSVRGGLAHLCRILVRDRRPDCPLNGILLLLPLGGTDSEDEADVTAEVLREDLKTVGAAVRLHCPLFALICDMETLPGFREFITCHKRDKMRRIGQRFPMESPELSRSKDTMVRAVDGVIQGFCSHGVRDLIYPYFEVRPPEANIEKNRKLLLLLDQLRERKDHLGRILANGLPRLDNQPPLFGGCYFAATGTAEQDQAFARGALKRLIECQNNVRWADAALHEDYQFQQLTRLGYALIAVLVLLMGGTAIALFLRR